MTREQTARISGEMEAARRVQVAMLPRVDGPRRFTSEGLDLAAATVGAAPARWGGGDLYGLLPARRAALVLPDRRRRRQRIVGEHLHGSGAEGARVKIWSD